MWKENKGYGNTEYELDTGDVESQNPLLLPVQNARFSHESIDERNSAKMFLIIDALSQNGVSYKIRQTVGLCLLPDGFEDVRRSLENVIGSLNNINTITESAEQLIPETGYLSTEIHGRGRMLRVHMAGYEEIAKRFLDMQDLIIFGSCQRIFPKGHTNVSDPHRDIEPQEKEIIKPTILALLEALPDLQPPYMKREQYVKLVKEQF